MADIKKLYKGRAQSRDDDFKSAVDGLKSRCHNSGYDKTMVNDILKEAHLLKRELGCKIVETGCEMNKIRWVTLSGSSFRKEQMDFVKNMNGVLKEHQIAFEIIKTTRPTIGSQLFNNFDKPTFNDEKCNSRCLVCVSDARGSCDGVVNSVTKKKYHHKPQY